MSRTLFAAGRLQPSWECPEHGWPCPGGLTCTQTGGQGKPMQRTCSCTNPACAEPREAITVSLRWEPGIGGIGLLAGWTAGDVVAHCGCVLREHEIAALAAAAEEDANEWGQSDA